MPNVMLIFMNIHLIHLIQVAEALCNILSVNARAQLGVTP